MALPAWGQAPGVFWTKSIGAQLFAVDSQTNVYANTGGTVITLSGDGVPLQTNSICPRPGLAQRDADGNYYFAGVLPSHFGGSLIVFDPQDFGGVVLSNLAVFLTKYSPAGNLLWATNFGPNGVRDGINVTDLVQDADGNMLVAYTWNLTTQDYFPVATKIGPGGSLLWSAVLPKESALANSGRVRLTAETGGNGLALTHAGRDPYAVVLSRFDVNGNLATVANWGPSHSIENLAPRTIVNSVGEFYNAEDRPNNGVQLTKRQASGSVIWRFYTGNVAQRVVGRDQFDGVHVATDGGQLARYDADGHRSWTINLAATCEELIVDSQGNRFLALADGTVARLGVQYQLSTSASAGGCVTLNPPGGIYNTTNVVTATAVATAGHAFLYWQGDATGASPSVNVSMERDKTIRAVFGTTLATTVAGSGQIQRSSPGTLYPHGSVVRLTAVPDPGNYFGSWGNAASGNTNPLYFTISSPTQTVSSIFGATPSGQAALTVQIIGRGRVTSNPSANVYTLNQAVTLTAVSDAGQGFLNWSGDASGTQNPLGVSMTQGKVITANFTDRPTLSASRPGLEGLTPDGFRLTLLSDPASVWQVMGSTNLTTWESLGWITNIFGEVQFMDPSAVNAQQKAYKAGP